MPAPDNLTTSICVLMCSLMSSSMTIRCFTGISSGAGGLPAICVVVSSARNGERPSPRRNPRSERRSGTGAADAGERLVQVAPVAPEGYGAWLAAETQASRVQAPHPGPFEVRRVGALVNDPRSNVPEVVRAVDG